MQRNAIGAWVLQGLLAAAFLAAGGAKLAGVPMMVQVFDQIGMGQWFRAVLTHFLVLHTSATPAVILLALNVLVVWLRRDQLAWVTQRNENA